MAGRTVHESASDGAQAIGGLTELRVVDVGLARFEHHDADVRVLGEACGEREAGGLLDKHAWSGCREGSRYAITYSST